MLISSSGGIDTFLPFTEVTVLSHDRIYFSLGWASILGVAVIGTCRHFNMLRLTKFSVLVPIVCVPAAIEALLFLPSFMPDSALLGLFPMMLHAIMTPLALVSLGLLIYGLERALLQRTLAIGYLSFGGALFVKYQVLAPSELPFSGPSLQEECLQIDDLDARARCLNAAHPEVDIE